MMEVPIWNPVERLLWGITITLMIITALLFLYNGKKKEGKREKIAMFGMAGIPLGQLFDRIFRFLADFFIVGEFKDFNFYGNFENLPSLFELFIKFGFISFTVGITVFLFSFEMIHKRTKYMITTSNFFIIIIMIFAPFEIVETLFGIVGVTIDSLIFLFILYQYTKWAQGDFKNVSLIFLYGTMLTVGGYIFSFYRVRTLNLVPLILSPIILSVVFCFYIRAFFLDPEDIYKIRKMSLTVVISSIVINIYAMILYASDPFLRSFLVPLILILTISLLLVFRILKMSKAQTASISAPGPNIFGQIIRPKKVTEEEVTVSKEKKICLVCKASLARKNIYFCPSCNSLYCIKCADTLATLENACWVCELPFDESKPVKLPEKEEEKVIIADEDVRKIERKNKK